MNEDFLDELGVVALGSRLKRLSDRLMADAARVYRHCGFDVQTKWFPLISLLSARPSTTVVEAAESLGVSQPAISQFSRQLEKAGLVAIVACDDDARRRRMALTGQGHDLVQQMQPMWNAVREAARSLCLENGNDFFPALRKLEQALDRKSLLSRTREALHDRDN